MKHIQVSVPGATYPIEIYGDNLKVIDGKAKLIVTDGNETIAVFSSFLYWLKVEKDTVDDEEHIPDKGGQRKIIEKKGKTNYVDINEAPCPEGPEPETPGRRRIQELSRKHRKPDVEPETPQ